LTVGLQTDPFRADKPTLLFDGQFLQGDPTNPWSPSSFDVLPDGQRFVMISESVEDVTPIRIVVELNWLGELKRKVAEAQ
jgi:hypothetical protein